MRLLGTIDATHAALADQFLDDELWKGGAELLKLDLWRWRCWGILKRALEQAGGAEAVRCLGGESLAAGLAGG